MCAVPGAARPCELSLGTGHSAVQRALPDAAFVFFSLSSAALFRTDGQLVASTMCDYTFRHEPLLDTALNRKIHSTESVQDLLAPLPPTAPLMQQDQPPSSAVPHTAARLQLSGGTGQRGHFYSPQYPSTYPKNTRCQYRFQAQPSERVRLLFVDVSLQRLDQSCITAPDVIKVFDGPESADPLLALICGQTAYLELLSSGQELMVQFVAKSHTSSKGFKAEFAFVPLVPPSPPRLGHPWWAEPSKPDSPWRAPGYGGNQSLSSSTSSSASCDRWFNSNDGPNGTFTSPNFPLPYPPSTHCTYHFDGHGKERVQIEFQEFDIHRVEDQNRDCEINSDSLIAYVTSNGQNDRIEGFCGQDLPPRLMSNGHQMTVVFRTLSHNDPAARPRPPPPVAAPKLPSYPSFTGHAKAGGHNHHPPGPKAADNRANADDEDYATSEESEEHGHGADGSPGKKFYSAKKPSGGKAAAAGQPTATEEPRRLAKGFRATYRFVTNFGVETGKQDSKSVCGFVYNSSESKNGTFTSPNYPGLYPKDTECHYFFYGNATERIQIVFTHFDVEGVTPCTLETASDYVEFSNVHAGDRKLFRHCGLKHPKSVESETDYFRVTFKSNARFDGTGFRATYAFVDTSQGSQRNQNGRKTVSTSLSSSAACTPPATLTVLCTDFLLLLLVSSYRRLLL